MATKKIDRSKRTKAELIEELETLQSNLAGQAPQDPTATAIARSNAAATREAVKSLSVDTIVQNGAQFGLQVQRTVSELTQQAVQKAEELKTLNEAIEIESKELERLYQLDVAVASVQALISEHEEKKVLLEKEIETARGAWSEESVAHTKAVRQRDAEIAANRQREQAEYDYRTKQERDRSTEEFTYKLRIQERDQAERIATAQKGINERMQEVTAKEQEIAEGNARIAGLDAEISDAVKKAVAIATSSLKKDLEGGFALEKKDLETRIQLTHQSNIALNQQLDIARAEKESLQKQLEAARSEVRDIARSAVEGASGTLALQKVMEVRQENGSTPRKS